MSKTYKATITPTVAGGNIEVCVQANNISQAQGIIRSLPYFKSFVQHPMLEGENNLTKLADLVKRVQAKHQVDLATID